MAPSRPLFGVPSSSISRRSSARLVGGVEPATAPGDLAVDVRDRLRDALAAVRVAAVAQLDGLELPRRRAGRHRGAAEGARLERDVDLDGRVAARVEDLAGVDRRRSRSFRLLGLVEVAVLLVERQLGPLLALGRRRAARPPRHVRGTAASRAAARARDRRRSGARRSRTRRGRRRAPRRDARRSLAAAPRAARGARPRGRRARRRRPGTRSRPPPPGAAPCARTAAPGSDSGTSWKIPSRPSCSRLIRSQFSTDATAPCRPRRRRTRADGGGRASRGSPAPPARGRRRRVSSRSSARK